MVASSSKRWKRSIIEKSNRLRKHKIVPQRQSLSPTTRPTETAHAISINDFPVELLTEIFHICTAAARSILAFSGVKAEFGEFQRKHSRYSTLHVGYTTNSAPFNLLQVCRTWRSIALNTPFLWQTLSGKLRDPCNLRFINALSRLGGHRLPYLPRDKYLPTRPEISHWLTLSGTAPLRLQLELDDEYPFQGSVYQCSLLRLFATQAHRWQALSIEVDTALTQELTSILRHHEQKHEFPLLERLDINFGGRSLPDQHIKIMDAVSSLKNLRHIIWHAEYFEAHDSMQLPWRQLHSIYIHAELTPASVMFYLSQCTAATDITFTTVTGPRLPPLYNGTVLHLPLLKHFHLDGSHVLSLFDSFLFPALETLETEVCASSSTDSYEILDNFLTRSGCCLKAIIVQDRTKEQSLLPDTTTTFFSRASLAGIPRVELQNVHIHRALLQAIQDETEALERLRTIPRLLGWDNSARKAVVGWKEFERFDTLRFSWKSATLHIINPIHNYKLRM